MVNQETSNVISVLKCLLCIGVVCIHSTFNEDSLGVSGNDISHFLIFSDFFVYDFLDKSCVPVFFVISGFLFFSNSLILDKESYSRKLKSRVKSLLVPYVIANAIYVLINIVAKRSLDISLFEFFDSWIGTNGFPADPPLWYIRDLMVLVVFSFVIYWLIQKFSYVIPILALVGWMVFPILCDFEISLLRGLAFFILGAYISIKQYDLLSFFRIKQFGVFFICFYVIILLLSSILNIELLSRFSSVVGVVFWFSVAYLLYNKKQISCSKYVVTGSIFVYLYHYYLAILIPRALMMVFGVSSFKVFIFYAIGVITTICILFIVYHAMNKYFKKLTTIVVGYRV